MKEALSLLYVSFIAINYNMNIQYALSRYNQLNNNSKGLVQIMQEVDIFNNTLDYKFSFKLKKKKRHEQMQTQLENKLTNKKVEILPSWIINKLK